jgi:hypothetical protein
MAITFPRTIRSLGRRPLHFTPEVVLDLWLTKYGDIGAWLTETAFEDGTGNLVMQDIGTLAYYYARKNVDFMDYVFETKAHQMLVRYELEYAQAHVTVRLKVPNAKSPD